MVAPCASVWQAKAAKSRCDTSIVHCRLADIEALISDSVCHVTAHSDYGNLCIRWAQAVDVNEDGAEETVRLLVLPLHHASYRPPQLYIYVKDRSCVCGGHHMQVRLMKAQGGSGLAVQCDVQDDAAQRAAFSRHVQAWGSLDVAVLNAGIMEKGLPPEPSLSPLGMAALYMESHAYLRLLQVIL